MFDEVGRNVTVRKLRLFGVACCHRIWNFMIDQQCRDAVDLIERFVEGDATVTAVNRTRAKLKAAFLAACNKRKESRADEVNRWCLGAALNLLQDETNYLQDSIIREGDSNLLSVWECTAYAVANYYRQDKPKRPEFQVPNQLMDEFRAQADLLREILGNRLSSIEFAKDWRPRTMVSLAKTIYRDKAFANMPMLGQALRNAGCDNRKILSHCNAGHFHVRGCWVLDSILGFA